MGGILSLLMITIPPWLDISVISAFTSVKGAVMNLFVGRTFCSWLVWFAYDRFFASVKSSAESKPSW